MRRVAQPISIRDSWVNDEFSARLIRVEHGAPFEAHEHWKDHVMVIVRGPVRVRVAGVPVDADRGDALFIPAEARHGVEALHERGGAYRCIFAYQDGDDRATFDKDRP